jgi:hypothetical protein
VVDIDLHLPATLTRPCYPAQWGNGVLTARTGWPATNPAQYPFTDWPIGLAPDGSGGAFVLVAASWWWPSAQGPLVLARVSASGQRSWVRDVSYGAQAYVGVIGPWVQGGIVPSGAGRCIVAWGGDYGPFQGQRFDAAGQELWAGGPVRFGPEGYLPEEASSIAAEPDGSDGILAAWFAYEGNWPSDRGLRLQRVDASGAPLFGPDGVAIPGASLPLSLGNPLVTACPQLVADGQGGGTILWAQQVPLGFDHLAQRFAPDGALVGGQPTVVAGSAMGWRGVRRLRHAVPDGAAGFYIGYPDAQGTLRLARWSGATAAVWDVNLGTPVRPVAFDIREDGQGGVLVAWVAAAIAHTVELRRLDASGNETWHSTVFSLIQLPTGASAWSDLEWAGLVRIVPSGDGGAIAIVQQLQGDAQPPRLVMVCVEADGSTAPPTAVTGRPTRQQHAVMAPVATKTAFVSWADDGDAATHGLDAWSQRVGCCSAESTEVPWPRPPCALVPLPAAPYGLLAVNLPCGNRDRQYGFLPLGELGVTRGVDVPPILRNRAASPPDWTRILVLGLRSGVGVALRSRRGKAVGKTDVVEGSGGDVVGTALTFHPADQGDSVLLVTHDGPPAPEGIVTFGLDVTWGDGEPPPLPAGPADRPPPPGQRDARDSARGKRARR